MKINKINAKDLTLQLFFDEFLNNKPVIITGEMEDWPLSGTDLNSFEKKYGDRIAPVRGSNVNDFQEYMEVNVSSYIENMKNNPEKWYCDFPTDFEEFPELEKTYTVPEYFSSNNTSYRNGELHQWLYLGGEGTGTPLHTDVEESHAWNALVFGEKEWVVFYPSSNMKEYEGKVNLLSNSNQANSILEKKDYFYFHQKPNEIVYIPSNFAHQVKNLAPSLCITGNFWNVFSD